MHQVLKHSGYYGDPENLLLAMIGDKRPYVHELEFRRIPKAWTDKQATLRQLSVQNLNINASEYSKS